MNIIVITTEKLGQSFIKKGIQEYEKRLSRYCKVKYIFLKKIEDMEKYIKNKTYVILVNQRGNMISSENLAKHFEHLALTGKSDMIFFLSSEQFPKEKLDMYLALTPMEMDHQLMTLTLYEQIYRAFTIINNLPYHK